MTAESLLRDLSTTLGLHFELQDWGISNADPARLAEFISFYDSADLHATQRFELGELVFASANERLRSADAPTDPPIRSFLRFLERHAEANAIHIRYWRSLGPSNEYPLAALLAAMGSRVP